MEKSNLFPGCDYDPGMDNVTPNDALKIDASVASKESKVYAARKLSQFFELDISIKILGVEIFSWHFPPVK